MENEIAGGIRPARELDGEPVVQIKPGRKLAPCGDRLTRKHGESSIERIDPRGKIPVCSLDRIDIQEAEHIRELSLQRLPQALYAAFSLRGERENNLDIQIPA